MKKVIAFLIAAAAWYAVVSQYFIMLDDRVVDILETTIRFFTYFTILTNILIAIYFTAVVLQGKKGRKRLFNGPGTLTAITGYITIVGLIYQIALRHLWQPEGLQWAVDELLHTVIPIAVIFYWYFNESSFPIRFQQIGVWLIYPVVYFIVILIRGGYSNFYPYPFVSVTALGLTRVLINGGCLIILYIVLSVLYIWLHSRSNSQ